MTTFFGAIADDFTGATDLAALLARSGLPVSLRIGLPEAAPGADCAPLEIIALKCRTIPAAEAVAQTQQALAWLRAAGAQRFYWKYCSTFDSTPEGNIGPVAEALRLALGAEQTVYCPAFPENGRRVFMGHLFVGDLPLHESPMKDHPLTPMRDSNLLRLLAPQLGAGAERFTDAGSGAGSEAGAAQGRVGLAPRGAEPVGLVAQPQLALGPQGIWDRLAALAGQGLRHVVLDAIETADLTVLAEACADLPLLTGGSAFAAPLPGIWQRRGLLQPDSGSAAIPHPKGPAVVLAGSCSAMTQAQVADFIARGHPAYFLDPLDLAERGVQPALDWLTAQAPGPAPMLYATAAPDQVRAAQERLGTARAGELVEQALARCAVAARGLGYRSILVAGGESSGAVTQALGVSRLEIGAEIAPGVPWCFASSGGERLALTLKSGNFGRETFFTDAIAKGQR